MSIKREAIAFIMKCERVSMNFPEFFRKLEMDGTSSSYKTSSNARCIISLLLTYGRNFRTASLVKEQTPFKIWTNSKADLDYPKDS